MKARAFSESISTARVSRSKIATPKAQFTENRIVTKRVAIYGGPGSGFHKHLGRPGARGGSQYLESGSTEWKRIKKEIKDWKKGGAKETLHVKSKGKAGKGAPERDPSRVTKEEKEFEKRTAKEKAKRESPAGKKAEREWEAKRKKKAAAWKKTTAAIFAKDGEDGVKKWLRKQSDATQEAVVEEAFQGDWKGFHEKADTRAFSQANRNPHVPAGDNYHPSVGWY